MSAAGPGESAALTEMIRTQDHPMGSQIRLHEGTAEMPSVTPQDIGIQATVAGIDVSGHQGNVDWAKVAAAGTDFAYVKATEGGTYVETDAEFVHNTTHEWNHGLGEIVTDNLFDKIHADPRWLAFLRKIGKAPEQLAKIEFKVTLQ